MRLVAIVHVYTMELGLLIYTYWDRETTHHMNHLLIRLKKEFCFWRLVALKFFDHLPARIVEYVFEYKFLVSKKTHRQAKNKLKKKKEKQKKPKQKRRKKMLLLWTVSVESLTGHYDFACKFTLCAFNLLELLVNFSWLLIWI